MFNDQWFAYSHFKDAMLLHSYAQSRQSFNATASFKMDPYPVRSLETPHLKLFIYNFSANADEPTPFPASPQGGSR